ncbi:hypothetical protein ACE1OC_41085 [Streptomyces sp. DSM 116496]|uniref:hypothetical protein n=1 Tax=Streptomyces stoeckheimensis TaxID=3344656 RepID=UPI0038B2CF11
MPKKHVQPGSDATARPQIPILPAQAAEQNRLTLPVVTAVIAFPSLGSALSITDMPTAEIYPLLAYCGAIGVAVVIAASGGRKIVVGLAQLLLRASQ